MSFLLSDHHGLTGGGPVVALGARLLIPLGISVVWLHKKALAATKTCPDGELWLMELQLNTLLSTRALLPNTNL